MMRLGELVDPLLQSGIKTSARWMDSERWNPTKATIIVAIDWSLWHKKIVVSVFRDAHSIIFIDFIEKEKHINGEHYLSLVVHLQEEIGKNEQEWRKNITFSRDNASCHKSIRTVAKLYEFWNAFVSIIVSRFGPIDYYCSQTSN